MKRILILILATVGLAITLPGCATSNTGKAVQGEGVLIPTVNAAMAGWKAYVVAGKASQGQIDGVQAAYMAYYNAQLAAEAALMVALNNSSTNASGSDLQTANTAVSAAETSLINLINQYTQ